MEISYRTDRGIIRLSARVIAAIKILSILIFVYSIFLYATAVYAQKDFSALYKKVAPSVVKIDVLETEGKLKSGTGFFIREDGLVVTNYHIMEGSVKAKVKLSNGEIIPIERTMTEDRERDLVLLKLRAKERFFPTLKFADTKIEAGLPVVVIGSPLGLKGTISDGIISAIKEIPNFGRIFQITPPISPGAGGSPVLNIKGEVVGVATALVKEGQNLNFAVPVESLNRLLKKSENVLSATGWYERGLKEKGEKAIMAFSRAIELDPKYALAYNKRGVVYLTLGDHRQAIRDFDRAIELDPKHASSYHNRGQAYDNLGNYGQAIEDYSRGIKLEPGIQSYYIERGLAYLKIRDYRQAVRDYDQAIKLDPKDALAYYERGVAYRWLGDYRQAIRDYDKAIELNYPRDDLAYYSRGVAYSKLGDHRQAIQDYDKAIQLEPKYAPAFYARGVAYFTLGDHRQAIRNFDRAIELDPKDAGTYYNRGITYGKLGDRQQAIRDLKTAAGLGSKEAQDFLRSQGASW